jgi:hypothetical protein
MNCHRKVVIRLHGFVATPTKMTFDSRPMLQKRLLIRNVLWCGIPGYATTRRMIRYKRDGLLTEGDDDDERMMMGMSGSTASD